MEGNLREKLESELQETDWLALRQHLARDAIIIVSESLSLLDAAEGVAKDDKTQVARWIEKGLLGKPTPGDIQAWEKQAELKFLFIILAPYVLIQKRAH